MEKELDLKSVLNHLPVILVVIGTFLGLYFVSPLAQDGVPMNIDLAFHYGRIACFEKSPMLSLPTFWCPQSQAGIASFQAYAMMPFHLVSIFSWVMSLAAAYKLMLVFTFFLLPAGALFLLWYFDMPLAGAFAYLLLIVEHGSWHAGSFDKIFLVGMFSNAFGSGMLLFALAGAYLLFEKPSWKSCIIASAITAIFFLGHAATFMFFPLVLILMAVLYKDSALKNWKKLAVYPLVVFLLVSYWLVPFIAKNAYYVDSGGGNVKYQEIQDYLFKDLSWILLSFSLIGFVYCVIFGDKRLKVLGAISLIIPLLWLLGFIWPSFFYFKYIQMIRNLGEARTFILIFAGIALGAIGKINLRIRNFRLPLAVISIILLYLIAQPLFALTDSKKSSILMSSQPDFVRQANLYSKLEGIPGRIIVEDTLFYIPNTVFMLSHPYALSPSISDVELLGAGDNLYNSPDFSNTQQDVFFDRPISSVTKAQMDHILTDLNVQYVIAFAGPYMDRFQNFTITNQDPPFTVYATNITSSYFRMEDARLSDEVYRRTSASVRVTSEGGELLFKVREFPNWQVKIDGIEVPHKVSDLGLLIVQVPAGEHIVTYDYVYRFVDIFGYILTSAGLIMIGFLSRKY